MIKELLKMAFNAGYDCSLMHNNGEHQGYYDFDEFYKCEIASLNFNVSDFFSFAKYLEENFKYYDNTDLGNVYKGEWGIYTEEDIYEEWARKRLKVMEMNLINNDNHTNLTSNVQFNELPDWFKKSKTINAIISLNNGYITWKDGIWKDGTWNDGTWEYGIWKDGIWKCGVWKDGVWKGGTWKSGTWKSGTWKSGTWKGGYKSIGKCKWTVMYNSESIKIGCKEKTIDDWEDFFNSDQVYQTKRGTEEFIQIHKAYRLAKYALENNL